MLPGDTHDPLYEEIKKSKEHFGKRFLFALKSIDLFPDFHTVGEVGDPMYIKNTTSGGVTSMLWVLGIVVIFIALLGVQIFENDTEERVSLPSVAVPFRASAAVTVELTFTGSGHAFKEASPCRDIDIELKGLIGGPFTTTCTLGNKTLTLQWSCQRCELDEEGASFTLKSRETKTFATAIRARVRT